MQRNTDLRLTSRLVSAAAVVGGICSLAAGTAAAVELGEIQVESTLGQPLRASIPFALNPNEQMYDFCVRLRPNAGDGLIPTITRASISVAGNRIVIVSEAVIRDPLLNLQVAIDCPYTPQIARQYTLVVDPVEFAENNRLAAAQPPAAEPAQRQIPPVADAAPAAPAPTAEVSPVVETVETAPVAATPAAQSPVSMGSEYRVVSGDSVSAIAARIDARPNSLRDAIDLIVASNPDAFVNGDPSLMAAGSLLRIPEMSADTTPISTPIVSAEEGPREYAPAAEPITEPPATPIASIPEPVADAPEAASEPAAFDTPQTEAVVEPTEPVAEASPVVEEPVSGPVRTSEFTVTAPIGEPLTATESPAAVQEPEMPEATPQETPEFTEPAPIDEPTDAESDAVADALQPGDVVMPGMTISADGSQSAPADSPAVVATDATEPGNSWSWLTWPIGAALLIVAGILLLAGRIRGAFSSIAVGAPDKPTADARTLQEIPDQDEAAPEPAADAPEPMVAEVAEPLVAEAAETTAAAEPVESAQAVVEDVDYEFTDTVVGDSISLDADLDAGTGLQDGGDLDVAEDFGFASTSGQVENDIDHEIPEEAAAAEEPHPTDVIPPAHREDVSSILEEEVVPEADDYDLSMIVDATKQSIDDTQLTAQDLQAIPVDSVNTDEYSISDDTLASEADLAALEQDYQEEYTQTQALSQEIEEAAAELAAKLEDDIDDDDPTGDEPVLTIEDPGLEPTAEMPASAPDNDLTAEMPARPPESEITAKMPAGVSPDDLTAEMPTQIADLDDTEEVPLEEATAEVTVNIAASAAAENDDLVDDVDVTSKLAAAGNEPTVEMPLDPESADDAKDE